MSIPTPHIAAKAGEIAKTVLMPGDPLRAKVIADTFLENVIQYNDIRGMLGFTGEYKGKKISVQGSGMGIPSIGIYSYELFSFYGVENIIRIGSAGAIHDDLDLGDLVVGMGASTNSSFGAQYGLTGTFSAIASYELMKKSIDAAEKIGVKYKVGNIFSSDTFYDDDKDNLLKWKKMGILAVEMEAAGLYMNAARLGKNALCLASISDCPFKGTSLPAIERQNSFTNMMKVALELA